MTNNDIFKKKLLKNKQMTKALSNETENMTPWWKPGMDQILRRQLRGFAYPTRPLRLPYALVSRSKDNGKGRRNV